MKHFSNLEPFSKSQSFFTLSSPSSISIKRGVTNWWPIHSCIQRGVTNATKWNRTILFLLFQHLSITLIKKHLHMPPWTISISPKQFRCYLKQFLRNNSGAVQIILRISLSSQTRHHTLSVSSQQFVNNVDMIETPLRSIVSSGIWKSVLTPT